MGTLCGPGSVYELVSEKSWEIVSSQSLRRAAAIDGERSSRFEKVRGCSERQKESRERGETQNSVSTASAEKPLRVGLPLADGTFLELVVGPLLGFGGPGYPSVPVGLLTQVLGRWYPA